MNNNLSIEFILIFAAFGLFLAQSMEYLQIFFKQKGFYSSSIAKGYNDAMKVMVLNRLGAIIYFMSLSLAIEIGAKPLNIIDFIIITLIALIVVNISLTAWQASHFKISFKFFANKINNEFTIFLISIFLASSLNLLGITIPLLLGSIYTDYRLTLANSGFLFNTIYTIVNVFFIESLIAKKIDEKNKDLNIFVFGIYIFRTFAILSMILLFLYLKHAI